MDYQYKCIELPLAVSVDRKGTHSDVVHAIEGAINAGAQGGWEYVGTEQVASVQNAGCLGGLFGGGQVTTTIRVMIFKKQV